MASSSNNDHSNPIEQDTQTPGHIPSSPASPTMFITPHDLLEQVTSQFTNALANIANQFVNMSHTKPPSAPLSTFSGQLHEDPIWFLGYMETYFDKAHINDDADRIHAIERQLKGEALRWYEPYRYVPESYLNFRHRFEQYFCSSQREADAAARLYGDIQKTGETAATFIIRKRALFTRINPRASDGYRASVLINQLLPEIRSRLRGNLFNNLDDLISTATQIENDLRDMPNQRNQIRNLNSQSNQSSNPPQTSTPRPNNFQPSNQPRQNNFIPQNSIYPQNFQQNSQNSRFSRNPPQNSNPNPRYPTNQNSNPQNSRYPQNPQNFQNPRQTPTSTQNPNYPRNQPLQQPFSNPQNNPRSQNSAPRPNNPCRYCQEWHFHNQCPKNPYNNRSINMIQPETPSSIPPTSQPLPSHPKNLTPLCVVDAENTEISH